jgi:ribosomal protein L11 methyltransferase
VFDPWCGRIVQIVKVTINAEAILTESISDYLIGVLNAAVEYSVNDGQSVHAIHAFIIADSWLHEERDSLETAVKGYSDEMADIFQVEKPSVGSEIISDQDWAKNWKEYFKPFEILEGLVIAPSWQPYTLGENQKVIVMDPGMAFGTGHHATTRLCLEMIKSETQCFQNAAVLDVGTGTGILGMAAALWGADRVLGIDNDDEAVAAAELNIRRNKLQDKMNISSKPLAQTMGEYPLVVANIVHDVLTALAEDLVKVTRHGGILILSGLIYGDQTRSITERFQKIGFRLLQEQQDGEWGALKLENML